MVDIVDDDQTSSQTIHGRSKGRSGGRHVSHCDVQKIPTATAVLLDDPECGIYEGVENTSKRKGDTIVRHAHGRTVALSVDRRKRVIPRTVSYIMIIALFLMAVNLIRSSKRIEWVAINEGQIKDFLPAGAATGESTKRLNDQSSYMKVVGPTKSRMIYLIDDAYSVAKSKTFHSNKRKTRVEVYPADFSDITQRYVDLGSSSDLNVSATMELRQFPEHEWDPDCVPMDDWQTTFHPTCNGFHENNMKDDLLKSEMAKSTKLISDKGFWRHAWEMIDPLMPYSKEYEAEPLETRFDGGPGHAQSIVLKTLKYEHNMEEAFFEFNRVDAIAMDILTKSAFIIDIHGFCGMSVYTEYAGGSSSYMVDRLRPLGKLKLAGMVAQGIADVHSITKENHVSLVHNDINFSNIVVGSRNKPLLNDFNIAVLQMWNPKKNEPCKFKSHFPNPQWRAPEEQIIEGGKSHKILDNKVDIYGLGNILFRFAVGSTPWKKPDGSSLTKDEKHELAMIKMKEGASPPIPETRLNTEDPALKALLAAIKLCYSFDPKDRPSAEEITRFLGDAIRDITNE